jgi:hypothetical protein
MSFLRKFAIAVGLLFLGRAWVVGAVGEIGAEEMRAAASSASQN